MRITQRKSPVRSNLDGRKAGSQLFVQRSGDAILAVDDSRRELHRPLGNRDCLVQANPHAAVKGEDDRQRFVRHRGTGAILVGQIELSLERYTVVARMVAALDVAVHWPVPGAGEQTQGRRVAHAGLQDRPAGSGRNGVAQWLQNP